MQIQCFSLSDIFFGLGCFVGGIYVLTSSSVWHSPFLDGGFQLQNNCRSTLAILAAGLGRNVFSVLISTFFGTIYSSTKWDRVRRWYTLPSCIILTVILATRENKVGGGIILALELDMVLESFCQLMESWNKGAFWKSSTGRRASILLSFLVTIVCCVFRLLIAPSVFIYLSFSVRNLFSMGALSLLTMSFGCVYYTTFAFVILRFETMDRIRRLREKDFEASHPIKDCEVVTNDWNSLARSSQPDKRSALLGMVLHSLTSGRSKLRTRHMIGRLRRFQHFQVLFGSMDKHGRHRVPLIPTNIRRNKLHVNVRRVSDGMARDGGLSANQFNPNDNLISIDMAD